MTSSMTNTSNGEGSQHQTKRHIERDSLFVQRMPEPQFYPFSTTSRKVALSVSSAQPRAHGRPRYLKSRFMGARWRAPLLRTAHGGRSTPLDLTKPTHPQRIQNE